MRKVFTLILMAALCHLTTSAQFSNVAPCNNRPTNGNDFDWRTQYFTIYTISNGLQNVLSPFHNFSLNNLNTNELSQYAAKDYLPQDGWVFIKKDFGNSIAGTDYPYLLLYNRFQGTLRLFMGLGQLYGQNDAATISLTYNSQTYRSAILENYAPTNGSALETFNNNVAEIRLSNYYDNKVLHWYYADFTMNYDPCICNFKSSLLFKIRFSSTASLQFKLEGTALQNFDAFGRSGGNGKGSTLGAINSTFANISKAGNTLSSYLTNTDKYISLSNENKNFFTALVGGANGLNGLFGIANFAIGLIDPAASAPPRPLAFDINLTGTGTITHTNPYGAFVLPIPGANNVGLDANTLPYYDNALGVFTLVKSPEAEQRIYSTSSYGYDDGRDGAWTQTYSSYNYYIPGDIKYSINPNAGLSLKSSRY